MNNESNEECGRFLGKVVVVALCRVVGYGCLYAVKEGLLGVGEISYSVLFLVF
jgi:hypothetical protein